MSKDAPTFEKALARLEKIVESIEQGKVGLEDSIKQYEEGMGLIRHCYQILGDAEMKIQHLRAAGTDGVEATSAPAGMDDD